MKNYSACSAIGTFFKILIFMKKGEDGLNASLVIIATTIFFKLAVLIVSLNQQ